MEATPEPKRAAAPRRLVRDRPEDFVADWFFPTPMPAFQAAIDVERTERRQQRKGPDGVKLPPRVWYVWSQRAQPDGAFVEGDVFHAPPVAPGPWGEQATGLHWTVQLKRLLDRTATIVVTEYREARTSEHEMSMDDLATLLRTGRLEAVHPLRHLASVPAALTVFAGPALAGDAPPDCATTALLDYARQSLALSQAVPFGSLPSVEALIARRRLQEGHCLRSARCL